MNLHIEHHTRYSYDELVSHSVQHLRLTPQDGAGQRVLRWRLKVAGGDLSQHRDSFGNLVHTLVMRDPHQEIDILARGEVETDPALLPPTADPLPLPIYLRTTPLTSADAVLGDFARQHSGDSLSGLQGLMHAITARVGYQRGSTGVSTTASQAFAAGAGVCQDHAHIFIACCRALGIPARYVSGYLFTTDGALLESHAWADAWVDGGWTGFDVSNTQMAHQIHVRLASGLDYRDACPVAGVRIGGGKESLSAQVRVSQSQQ